MTFIRVSCSTCGEKPELQAADIDLQVHEDDAWAHASYAFSCPTCHDIVKKPADDHIISLLQSAGVQIRCIPIPAEAREIHAGPAIGLDDLLDLCLKLYAPGRNCLAAYACPR